jgi:hypothetical protein
MLLEEMDQGCDSIYKSRAPMIKKELDKIAQVEEQLFKLDEFKEVLVSQLQEVLIA